MTHWTATDLDRLRNGGATLADLQSLGEHLRDCVECAQRASAILKPDVSALANAIAVDGPVDDDLHPEDDLGAYVDGTLDRDRNAAVADHIALCAGCRSEVEDLRRFRRTIRPAAVPLPRRRSWRRPVLQLLAAGLAVAAVLTIAVGIAVAIERLRTNAVRPSQTIVAAARSIAVLPFQNLTATADDDFLSVGIADALTGRLENKPGLSTRPMSSVLKVARQSPTSRTATAALKVDALLEGQIHTTENAVRVTLQLTDGRSGHALWSDSVDGRRADLLELVDHLTARTELRLANWTGAANVRNVRGSEARTTSPEAYEAYLRERALAGSVMPAQFAARVDALQKAIALDPKFAAAHADLAIALELGLVRGFATDADTILIAQRHAREAVRLDPRLAEAHMALARVLVSRAETCTEGIREIVVAIELNPTNTHALQLLTTYFAVSGDLAKAQRVDDRILALDPLSDEARIRGYWFVESGQPEEAIRLAQAALAHPDTELAGHDIRGLAFILQGDLDAADREADAAVRALPNHYMGQSLKALVAAGRGDRTGAEAWLAALEPEARRNHFAAIRVALCRAKLGDRDAALDWIEHAVANGHQRWYSLATHPWFAPLRNEPRFQATIAGIQRNLNAARADALRAYAIVCGDAPPPVRRGPARI
jgi:serine/threonine-protein kinase